MNRKLIAVAAILAACILGCGPPDGEPARTVVVYTALDEMYSAPILEAFEEETGINVEAVYDTEAQKTTGLRTRLVAEKDRPRADVFWNNEVAQTILLQDEGVLAPYASPAAGNFPDRYVDEGRYWHGFAARGRVIIYNTDLVDDPPTRIRDLLDPKWAGKAAIAKPLFGTTATHAAALFAEWGAEEATGFFEQLIANDIAVLAGNATVRDLVARGEYVWGLTDTDDANGAVEDGYPVEWIFPDQGDGELGTLIIPNTVALIRGAPHPEAGQALIDYLLRPETEAALARMRSIQIPLQPGVDAPDDVPDLAGIRTMDVGFDAMADAMPATLRMMEELFQR